LQPQTQNKVTNLDHLLIEDNEEENTMMKPINLKEHDGGKKVNLNELARSIETEREAFINQSKSKLKVNPMHTSGILKK